MSGWWQTFVHVTSIAIATDSKHMGKVENKYVPVKGIMKMENAQKCENVNGILLSFFLTFL